VNEHALRPPRFAGLLFLQRFEKTLFIELA
jgi:hypothetical protein